MIKKILLADDDEGILALLAATLGNHEIYELLLATDGEEALRVALQRQPDLLVLDVAMPKKDGYQVCRSLKADCNSASIKIMILTAMAQDGDLRKAMEAGADDYFIEPFSPSALLQAIEELLNSP